MRETKHISKWRLCFQGKVWRGCFSSIFLPIKKGRAGETLPEHWVLQVSAKRWRQGAVQRSLTKPPFIPQNPFQWSCARCPETHGAAKEIKNTAWNSKEFKVLVAWIWTGKLKQFITPRALFAVGVTASPTLCRLACICANRNQVLDTINLDTRLDCRYYYLDPEKASFRRIYASSEHLYHKRRQVFPNQTNGGRPLFKTIQNKATHI